MDALSFLKLLWRPTPTPTSPAANYSPTSFADTDDDIDDDDADSFFELDFALSDNAKSCDSPKVPINVVDDDSIVLKFHKSSSTPVSPISILRSSPSFRGQMFRKSREATEKQKAGYVNRTTKKSARLFAVRLRAKEFGGDDGPKRNNAEPKDGFVKYMKKPFGVSYVGGASRSCGHEGRPKSEIQFGNKNMGKSKSAVSSSGAEINGRGRRNDSMAEQQEGINGAILHCKKSYYPSQ